MRCEELRWPLYVATATGHLGHIWQASQVPRAISSKPHQFGPDKTAMLSDLDNDRRPTSVHAPQIEYLLKMETNFRSHVAIHIAQRSEQAVTGQEEWKLALEAFRRPGWHVTKSRPQGDTW